MPVQAEEGGVGAHGAEEVGAALEEVALAGLLGLQELLQGVGAEVGIGEAHPHQAISRSGFSDTGIGRSGKDGRVLGRAFSRRSRQGFTPAAARPSDRHRRTKITRQAAPRPSSRPRMPCSMERRSESEIKWRHVFCLYALCKLGRPDRYRDVDEGALVRQVRAFRGSIPALRRFSIF